MQETQPAPSTLVTAHSRGLRRFFCFTFIALSSCGSEAVAPAISDLGIVPQKQGLSPAPQAMRSGVDRNKCIDVPAGNFINWTHLQIYDCNGTGAQGFLATGGVIRVGANKCVDVTDGADRNGTYAQLWDCTDNNKNQQFILRADGLIQWAGHNKCLDLTASTTRNGTPILLWDCDASKINQKWLFASNAPAAAPAPQPASPASPTTPVASKGSACKRGLAFGGHSDADLRAIAPSIGWWYNWSPKPEAAVSNSYKSLGLDFVPMVWGGQFDQGALKASLPPSGYLLTFNEPNFYVQANLTPEQAAALWPQIEAIADAHNMKIVSPALNYCGGGCNQVSPFDWFDRFFAACPKCRVDYLAFHWYACSKDALTWVLGQYETRYKKPVWLTEFSCLDSGNVPLSEQIQYMKDAVSILENDPQVFRYAWFTGRWDNQATINLFGADGQLTELGKAYFSAPGGCH